MDESYPLFSREIDSDLLGKQYIVQGAQSNPPLRYGFAAPFNVGIIDY